MSTAEMYLAGDIGGTKTSMALMEGQDGKLLFEREQTFKSDDYGSLESIIAEFLAGCGDRPQLRGPVSEWPVPLSMAGAEPQTFLGPK